MLDLYISGNSKTFLNSDSNTDWDTEFSQVANENIEEKEFKKDNLDFKVIDSKKKTHLTEWELDNEGYD